MLMLVKFNPKKKGKVKVDSVDYLMHGDVLLVKEGKNNLKCAYRKFFFQTRAFVFTALFSFFWKPQVSSNFHLWLVIRSTVSVAVSANSELRNAIRSSFPAPSQRLQQGAVAVLPAQARGLRVLVQVRRLAEALPTLETSVRLLSRVDPDVFLAVGEGEEGLAADFAGVLPSALHHQHVMLRQSLLALGQDVGRRPGQLWGEGIGSTAVHLISAALVQKQRARHAG